MKAAPQPLDAVSDERLALAWRQMRRPPTWPATLEQALADPTRAKCIRGYAASMGARLGRPRFDGGVHIGHRLPHAPVPPTPTAPLPRQQASRAMDRKRAAANDFDERDDG